MKLPKQLNKYTAWLVVPQNLFVVVAILFGVLFVFRIVPIFGNDEIVHFPRAYHIQEGNLWTEHLDGYNHGGRLPTQIKQFNDSYREQVQSPQVDRSKLEAIHSRFSSEKLRDHNRGPLSFTSAGVYSAWGYAPPAAGILVARLLDMPLNWYVYMGRLFALGAYILLVYFAIKYIPFGKIFLLVIALLPTALSQAGTIGIDGLVNGLSWLVIALTLAVFAQKLKVSTKLVALLAGLSLFLTTTKQGYAPIALLPLVIPARLYPITYKKVWMWRLVFAGTLLVVSLWYLGITSPLADVMHNIQRPGLNVDEASQLHYVFRHPLQFLSMIFIQPLTIWSANIYAGIVGILTNKVIWLPIPIIGLLYVVLLVCGFHKERPTIARRDRLFVLASSITAFLASFFLINLALYLSFTRVGYDHVEGLQGRYFLALLPLLGVILHVGVPKLFLKVSDRLVGFIVVPGMLLGLIIAAIVIR